LISNVLSFSKIIANAMRRMEMRPVTRTLDHLVHPDRNENLSGGHNFLDVLDVVL
jgi:hypothetical protein